MKYAVIKRPSLGTFRILKRKITDLDVRTELNDRNAESVGICQGSVLEILVASDIAEKKAGVVVEEISGSCPQHITCLAVMGDTEAVDAAIEAIRMAIDEM